MPFTLAVGSKTATCQQQPDSRSERQTTAPELPSGALDAVMSPFLEIHADPANWSPVELEAYRVMVEAAARRCAALEKVAYDGEELLSLAHLCASGKNWPGAYSAAVRYTRGGGANTKEAFEILLQADVGLGKVGAAVEDATEFASRVPFDSFGNKVLSDVVNSLEIIFPEEDLKIALLRQPPLLKVLSGGEKIVPYALALEEAWQTITLLHLADAEEEEARQRSLLEEALRQCDERGCQKALWRRERAQGQFALIGRKIQLSKLSLEERRAPALYIYLDSKSPAMAAYRRLLQNGQASEHRHAIHLREVVANPDTKDSSRVDTLVGKIDLISDTLPFFVFIDKSGYILFAGRGNLDWVRRGRQADVLFSRHHG